MLGGKLRDVRHTVGHVTADGVEALEDGSWGDMRLDIVDNAMELVERLRGLRVEEDIMTEVELLHLVEVLDDDGRRLRLTYETKHLGMTFLAEDDDRAFPSWEVAKGVILRLNPFLELEHHRTGGIDNLDVVLAGQLIGLWGLTMGPQQHLHVVELAQVVVVDGDQTHLPKALTLHAVVNDIAKTVEGLSLCQFFLGFLDGGGHSEAETTAFIYFYLNHTTYHLNTEALLIPLVR